MSQIKITHQQWMEEAKQRYGDRARDWRFVCPVCKTIQSGRDFLNYCDSEQASTVLGFSCIGRFMPNPSAAFGDHKGTDACDYTTGGLLNVSPVRVTMRDEEASIEISVFDFADRPLVGQSEFKSEVQGVPYEQG